MSSVTAVALSRKLTSEERQRRQQAEPQHHEHDQRHRGDAVEETQPDRRRFV